MKIEPSEKEVCVALEKALARLGRALRLGSPLYEPIARCYRWLDDTEKANEYFRKCIDGFVLDEQETRGHELVGNWYRLMGDDQNAHAHFKVARGLYKLCIDSDEATAMDVEHMVPVSFLLGNDDEVVELVSRLREKDPDRSVLAYTLEKLSRARCQKDAILAEEAIEEMILRISKNQSKVWNTGSHTLWDMYELAEDIRSQLNAGRM